MSKINFTIILLCLGLTGYTYAKDEMDSTIASCGEKAREVEEEVQYVVPFRSYAPSWGRLMRKENFVWSPYSINTGLLTVLKLLTTVTDQVWPNAARWDVKMIRFISELAAVIAVNTVAQSLQHQDHSKYQPLNLDRLILLEHAKHGKLGWREYVLAAGSLMEVKFEGFETHGFLGNFIFWFTIYACTNYLWRGERETMLPQLRWGRIGWIPLCLRAHARKNADTDKLEVLYSLDNYFSLSYKPKTEPKTQPKTGVVLVSLGTDRFSNNSGTSTDVLFVKTDGLCMFERDGRWARERHGLDGEIGIGLGLRGDRGRALHLLVSVEYTVQCNKYFSWTVAASYRTRDCIEGITASKDGLVISTSLTVHIGSVPKKGV